MTKVPFFVTLVKICFDHGKQAVRHENRCASHKSFITSTANPIFDHTYLKTGIHATT
ncbi:hypothetical protein ACFP1I_11925 [Dyadobacter subterraneus]|uniref:Uncharacterized protein n=1 Tax=Dyadobacter subterraneus TaxID=2773304 RepID=A0ABR9WDR3_9BACT|nr:hypothetical protein [Dyadobacter subterraneus]MBE9463633.1 hypothetical protein [Dyadobacter subterraneus]